MNNYRIIKPLSFGVTRSITAESCEPGLSLEFNQNLLENGSEKTEDGDFTLYFIEQNITTNAIS